MNTDTLTDTLTDPVTADGPPIGPSTLRRIAAAWPRRATVRTDMDRVVGEADGPARFDPELPDYPERILPFADHPRYLAAEPHQRALVNTLGWLAYNERVVAGEEHVANPTFAMLARGEFPGVQGFEAREAVQQAHVDEAWHTYMHMIAVRRTRQLRAVTSEPPYTQPIANRILFDRQAAAGGEGERRLLALLWSAVGEISINGLLDLLAGDDTIQPMHTYIAALHERDENAHGPVMFQVMKDVFVHLTDAQRQLLIRELPGAITAFGAEDYELWPELLRFAGIAGAEEIIEDCKAMPGSELLVTGFGGVQRLIRELGIEDQVDFDFAAVQPRT